MIHACNFSIQEAKEEDRSKSEASMVYVVPSFEHNIKTSISSKDINKCLRQSPAHPFLLSQYIFNTPKVLQNQYQPLATALFDRHSQLLLTIPHSYHTVLVFLFWIFLLNGIVHNVFCFMLYDVLKILL